MKNIEQKIRKSIAKKVISKFIRNLKSNNLVYDSCLIDEIKNEASKSVYKSLGLDYKVTLQQEKSKKQFKVKIQGINKALSEIAKGISEKDALKNNIKFGFEYKMHF